MNISKVSENVAVPELSASQLYQHNYFLANKERFNAYRIRYREANLVDARGFEREYHLVHKERRNECSRNYYWDNIDAVKEQKAEKFECEYCGGRYTRSNKLQHEKTNLHIRSLEINEIIK